MAKDIEPKLKLISDYLKINKNEKFVIPEYQRGYSWQREQCEKLLQDIENFMKSDIDDPYFFGTIIVDCSDADKSGSFCLVDGQQRTTTFLLLLKALQLRLQEVITNFKKDEETKLTLKVLEVNRDKTLKILFKADDEKVYEILADWAETDGIKILENKSINEKYGNELQTIISASSFEDAENKVQKIPRKQKDNKYTNHFRNFKYFYEQLGTYSESNIKDFAKTFLEKCQVIEIRSWQLEQAITMFNSLNSTGMPLSTADIISAQLYSKVGNGGEEFNTQWKTLINLADSLSLKGIVDIDSILQQFMYIKRAFAKEGDVSTPGIRNYYTNINKALLDAPFELCNEFLKIAQIWDAIRHYPLVKLLLKFNENIKLYLISFLYRYSVEDISKETVEGMGECLLRLFTVLELVEAGYSSKNFKSFLFEENIRLVDSSVTFDAIKEDFDAHIHKNWKEDSLLQAFDEYDGNILVFLNEYLFAKEKGLPFDFTESVNIEHIMPASGKNIDSIRVDAGIKDKADFEQIVNKLGNKILLEEEINKSISNEWFKTKKQKSVRDKAGYKNSRYGIAQELTDYKSDVWTQNDIDIATHKAATRIVNFIEDL